MQIIQQKCKGHITLFLQFVCANTIQQLLEYHVFHIQIMRQMFTILRMVGS